MSGPGVTSRRLPLRTGLEYHLLEWPAEFAVDHTVVLVHGFLDFAWGWEDVGGRLAAAGFHVVAPDMRGHGDSDRVGAGGYYHFMDYVADLFEVVRLAGRARVSLVGHSMGGGIAGYFAGTFPERVHKLALLEGINPPEHPMDPARVAAFVTGWTSLGDRARGRYAGIAEAAARLQKSDPRLEAGLARRLAEKGTRARPDGGVEFKHDPLHTTTGPYGFVYELTAKFWRRVACETLLVDASDSEFRMSPEEQARRHGCFARRRYEVLAGAGHMMQRHQPAALAELLVDFLAD